MIIPASCLPLSHKQCTYPCCQCRCCREYDQDLQQLAPDVVSVFPVFIYFFYLRIVVLEETELAKQEVIEADHIVKLVYDNASHYSFRAVNWSYSKGDTYEAACVILNGSTKKLVEDTFLASTLKTVTLNKLYVALTRSKGDLYIVTPDEFEGIKEKYYK